MKNVAIPVEVQRQAQIELIAQMRRAPPFHPTPLQMAQRVQEVANDMRGLTPGSVILFFRNPRGSLSGLNPMQALAAGVHNKVRDLAQAYADGR